MQGDEEADGPRHRLLKVGDAHYLANLERVQPLLSVERYAERWQLIPLEELHSSSVQQPAHKDWCWILHVRRVPVAAPVAVDELSAQAAPLPDMRPRRAGVGGPEALVWTCWDCFGALGGSVLKMPLYGLTNDSWIGRERPLVRDVSDGTKMLASLRRCCMKHVRLGQNKDPILKER